jgi:hypothetical protein
MSPRYALVRGPGPAIETAGKPTRHAGGRTLEQAADCAVGAPSVHDAQPWRIELQSDRLEIRADRTRQLPGVDPLGRELVQSAGAALFNVRVALAARGWAAEVHRLPCPDDPDLLAEVRLALGTPETDLGTLAPALLRRRTNRRRFTGGLVPDEILRRLTDIAEREGVLLVPVVHEAHRRLVTRLTQQADRLRNAGPAHRAGRQTTDRTMVLLATRTDDESAWLRSGEALQHVLLELTRLNWVADPLPQAIEVPVTRTQLRAALTWHAHPQMVLRIGHAAQTVPSPRRG